MAKDIKNEKKKEGGSVKKSLTSACALDGLVLEESGQPVARHANQISQLSGLFVL